MREVRVSAPDWSEVHGLHAVIPVIVDWPELRLTRDQILANAVADADGQPRPFPNQAIFAVVIERPQP